MVIRDPVHGDLRFTEQERRVMDSRQFQRLRGVRQTGTAYLVYPGCVHTRFEHSLGTAAMAKRIIFVLKENGVKITSDQEAIVSLAALVHDISHLPFGHTFEDERKLFPRHDTAERLRHFLSQDQIGDTLAASGYRDQVLDLLTNRGFDPPWMRQIVSSTVDADLLDYLRRDAYFSGLQQDYDDRIFSTFTVADGQLAINMSKLSTRTELLHLLRLRYFLTERVYYHHAKVSSGAMIAKAVELAVGEGLTEQDIYPLTDGALLRSLIRRGNPAIERLIRGVVQRQLLKRAYVLSAAEIGRKGRDEFIARYNRSIEARQQVENEIASSLGIESDQVILYCPDISLIKEARVFTLTRAGVRRLNEPLDSPPFDVKAVEDQYERLWCLYVFVPEAYRDKADKICEAIFGEKNALVSQKS
jgi:HD superfamily phosphohydrolase